MNWGIVEFDEDEQRRSYLLYRCESSDEYSGWLHIVDLQSGNAITRVEDFTGNPHAYKHLLYHRGVLYMASDHDIKVCAVEAHQHEGGDINVGKALLSVHTISARDLKGSEDPEAMKV